MEVTLGQKVDVHCGGRILSGTVIGFLPSLWPSETFRSFVSISIDPIGYIVEVYTEDVARDHVYVSPKSLFYERKKD